MYIAALVVQVKDNYDPPEHAHREEQEEVLVFVARTLMWALLCPTIRRI